MFFIYLLQIEFNKLNGTLSIGTFCITFLIRHLDKRERKQKSHLLPYIWRVNSYFFDLNSLRAPTPQNNQTHSNNLSVTTDELYECVWPIFMVGAKSIKSQIKRWTLHIIQIFFSHQLYLNSLKLLLHSSPSAIAVKSLIKGRYL